MATVEFSQGLMNRVVAAFCSPGAGSGGSGYTGSYSGGPIINPQYPLFPWAPTYGSRAGIYIMKGTAPTSFSALTSYSAGPTSDILCYFNSSTDFSSVSTADNKFVMSTSNKVATASGTATWFWAIGPAEYNTFSFGAGITSTAPLCQQFIGSVGATGSGADLEITSTSLTSGQAYRITGLTINISPTYTV